MAKPPRWLYSRTGRRGCGRTGPASEEQLPFATPQRRLYRGFILKAEALLDKAAGLPRPRTPLPAPHCLGRPAAAGGGSRVGTAAQRAGPGQAAEGREREAGAARRHRPGPAAAAGSRQIRVSWRGLTCEPARSSGAEPRGRLSPARPPLSPVPAAAPPPPRRPAHGEQRGNGVTAGGGRRGGEGEGGEGRRQRAEPGGFRRTPPVPPSARPPSPRWGLRGSLRAC